jgi:hypothetical protein
MTALRQRVPISRNFPRKSLNSARQRVLLLASGRGENHFSVDDALFTAKVSMGKFGATVWGLKPNAKTTDGEEDTRRSELAPDLSKRKEVSCVF